VSVVHESRSTRIVSRRLQILRAGASSYMDLQ